jgi:predicted ATPase
VELLGREAELADLLDRLSNHRHVTVTGPGGVGKTALAGAAVDRLAGEYERGSLFVDLTLVESADAVGAAMAAQLGFSSFAALLGSPIDQPVLLLVDNCEHLIDAAADAITRLLEACQSPTVVATSRSSLDLPGESVIVLGPLPVPGPGLPDEQSPSVRLFSARARDAGVVIEAEQLEAVGDLCRALDGLPLAIEVAAARARTMTPTEMIARLDLDTLARPRFRGSRRHRSLRQTIEWSYELLDEPDRRMFDRLGVLAGPFSFETAHAVGAGPDDSPADSLERIDTLVGASLLTAEPRDQVTRYRQLDLLRAFARERLDSDGEWESTWERFVDHVLESALAVSVYGGHGWNAASLAELLAMYDHLLAALRWCLEHDARPTRAFPLQAMLWDLLFQGHLEDATVLCEQTLDRWPDPTTEGWADAAATVATCRYLIGSPKQAISLAEQALNHLQGSVRAPCILQRITGQAKETLGDPASALEHYAEAAAVAQAGGFGSFALMMSLYRAKALADLGDVDEALHIVGSVRSDAAATGMDFIDVWARTVMGHVMLRVDVGRAVAVIADALDMVRGMDNPGCFAANLHSLALAHISNGDLAEAAGSAVELFDDLAVRGTVARFRPVLRTAAVILQRGQRPAWADVAATAAALPHVGVLGFPGRELFDLPEVAGRVVTQGEAVTLARRELRVVVGREASTPAQPAVGVATDADDTTLARVFVRMGEFWEVDFEGRAVNLKPSKGMDDLARLLGAPEHDIHCTELAGAGVEQASTGERIDQAARRQYEDRLRELQAEVDEAESDNDLARAERAQQEFDTLLEHLSAALGLGGRARRTGGTTERARSTVTQRIRSTIKRIAAAHPELGRHLQASIVTGTYCSYRPERPTRWRT